MTDTNSPHERIGWNLQDSYLNLPENCYAKANPLPVQEPALLLKNDTLAQELGLSFEDLEEAEIAELFSGNVLPDGATPLSMAYAGHQFGNFTMLGDGRAHLILEHQTPDGHIVDIHLKGSGRTPFSKGGDGRGAIGPMLREYLISESMMHLGISTTRSLAVVTTGEPVFRRSIHPGAILTRVATSHLRVGTFQYLAAVKDVKALKQMADFAIERHYPDLKNADQPYLGLLEAVIQNQIDLVVDWMRVGFIHGVMNTDNMTISGETIDYGPCAFMDAYDPNTVFSSIDHGGRYAFSNQGPVANWNLARFAETLLPIMNDDIETSLKQAEPLITSFTQRFQDAWTAMMRKKLGLFGQEPEDLKIIDGLLSLMEKNGLDYTNTFRSLISESLPDEKIMQTQSFQKWWNSYKARQAQHQPGPDASLEIMKTTNPAIIARNHQVENALEQAELKSDLKPLHRLLTALSQPYEENAQYQDLSEPPAPQDRVYQTFCGT